MKKLDTPSAKASAVGYLARREHSGEELKQKLQKKGFDEAEINTVIEQLKQQNLQSDSRFAESFINARIQRGYGSVRIKMELKSRGVDAEIIEDKLANADIDWFALATQVRFKHFGEDNPKDYKLRAKQQRFLQYRGFTQDQIQESFNIE